MIRKILNHCRAQIIAVANDVQIAIANAEGDGAVFEIQQKDSLFIPYGEYRHEKGLQVFDRAAAEEMRAAANSLTGKVLGIPIYFGHPDVKGRPDTNPAAPARGWVQDIEIENDGMRVPTKFGRAGTEAIENAEFRFYSPYWLMKKVNGKLRPVQLLSIGLTNHPRIPVPAIANDNNSTEEKNMPDWLLKLIQSLLPTTIANDKGENLLDWLKAELAKPLDQIDVQVKDAIDWLMRSKERVDNLEAAAQGAANDKSEITRLGSLLEDEGKKITAANDRVSVLRTSAIDLALDRVLAAGKLTEAERTNKRAALLTLENDAELLSQLLELEKVEPKLKTATQAGDLSGAKAHAAAANDATARAEQRQAKVQEEFAALPNDMPPAARHNEAWLRAQRKHPKLFSTPAGDA